MVTCSCISSHRRLHGFRGVPRGAEERKMKRLKASGVESDVCHSWRFLHFLCTKRKLYDVLWVFRSRKSTGPPRPSTTWSKDGRSSSEMFQAFLCSEESHSSFTFSMGACRCSCLQADGVVRLLHAGQHVGCAVLPHVGTHSDPCEHEVDEVAPGPPGPPGLGCSWLGLPCTGGPFRCEAATATAKMVIFGNNCTKAMDCLSLTSTAFREMLSWQPTSSAPRASSLYPVR